MERSFEKRFEVEIPKLSLGLNHATFEIDDTFFDHFDYGFIHKGNVRIEAELTKYNTHLDAIFHISGMVELECDRCMEPYPHHIEATRRVIFTFDANEEFDTDEVVPISRDEPHLQLSSDFYDFISLEVPLRKVPDFSVHRCPENVLALLGIDPITGKGPGEEEEEDDFGGEEDEEDELDDPRWKDLKKLKNLDENDN